MKQKIFSTIVLYIVKESDILDLIEYDLLIDNNVKKILNELIEKSFSNYTNFFYEILNSFYIPSINYISTNINDITDKDKYKISNLLNFIHNFRDIYVIDIYDYLYSIASLDELTFSMSFYDFIGNELMNKNIPIDYLDEYFYIIKKLFDIFVLNTIFSRRIQEAEENIVFGVNLVKNNFVNELHVYVCES